MNSEKNWFALEITVASEAAEAVEYAFNELDALGTEINNLGKNPTATLVVNGYFHELPADETVRRQINEALRIYGFTPDAVSEIDSRRIGDVDWLFEWKKHWKPTETNRFIVAPTWENVEHSDKIVVRIEPNMAFGTGTHETTRLCLKAIEENFHGAMSFLDVGTGTGILSIAVAKFADQELAAPNFGVNLATQRKITGYDTDDNSISIARENAELNDAGEQTEFFTGSISEKDSEYDFVCANITIDVIFPLLPLLLEKSKRVLVLSGILNEQQDLTVAELKKHGIENPKIEFLGEWISVLIEK